MNKFAAILSVSTLLLVGCGASPSESDKTSDSGNETEEVAKEEGLYEFNEVLYDEDDFKATLVELDKTDTDEIVVKFDIENKSDQSIEVQSRSVSIDDRMLDDFMATMSQEVAPGKSADAVLKISDLSGEDIPELKENLEMILNVFSWDDMDYTKEVDVKIEI